MRLNEGDQLRQGGPGGGQLGTALGDSGGALHEFNIIIALGIQNSAVNTKSRIFSKIIIPVYNT